MIIPISEKGTWSGEKINTFKICTSYAKSEDEVGKR